MTDKENEGRTEEQAAKAAPLSLSAGSYDVEALLKGTSGVEGVDLDKREKVIGDAIASADNSIHKQSDPSLEPGSRYQDVERPDLGVTERIQVYDPPTEEVAPPPPPPPPPTASAKEKGKTEEAGDAGAKE